jgi:hypothetical protein
VSAADVSTTVNLATRTGRLSDWHGYYEFRLVHRRGVWWVYDLATGDPVGGFGALTVYTVADCDSYWGRMQAEDLRRIRAAMVRAMGDGAA